MNISLKGFSNSGISTFFTKIHYISVRYRYYAEKIAAGPKPKKFGYEDKIFKSGILPRLKDAKVLPGPLYKPKNCWTKEKCSFGQNDYIDILGGGKLKPFDVCYEVPKWMRGIKGNEMQLLIIKKNRLAKTSYPYDFPTSWHNMNKRIRYLYKYLNTKTKTGLSND